MLLTEVTKKFEGVKYMSEAQALALRDLMIEFNAKDILEIGFYQGKSTAYIASILKEVGGSKVTTFDLEKALDHQPNINDLLGELNLEEFVDIQLCKRSYTWTLTRLFKEGQKFDFCYFDGGHNWDQTSLGLLLVDLIMKPGGVILVDDMDWSMANSAYWNQRKRKRDLFDDDEVSAKPVRLAFELILGRLGYEDFREIDGHSWAIAKKPSEPDA